MVPVPTVAIVVLKPSKHIARLSQRLMTITQLGGICTPYVYTRNDVATKAPVRLVYAARRFPNALLALVQAPTVAIVAYNPLKTHRSTLTTTSDHHTTPSRDIHSSCARNDVATKAPARLVYAVWRLQNALQADGTGSYGCHSGVQPPPNT